jgi:hypothetical protein
MRPIKAATIICISDELWFSSMIYVYYLYPSTTLKLLIIFKAPSKGNKSGIFFPFRFCNVFLIEKSWSHTHATKSFLIFLDGHQVSDSWLIASVTHTWFQRAAKVTRAELVCCSGSELVAVFAAFTQHESLLLLLWFIKWAIRVEQQFFSSPESECEAQRKTNFAIPLCVRAKREHSRFT